MVRITDEMVRRVAKKKKPDVYIDPETGKEIDLRRARILLAPTTWQLIRRAFPRKVWPWFLFYRELGKYWLGVPPPERMPQMWKRQTNFLIQSGLSPASVNMLASEREIILAKMRDIVRDRSKPAPYKQILKRLVPIYIEVLKDKKVYVKPRPAPIGAVRFQALWKMRAPEEELEVLKDDDPYTYQLMVDRNESIKQIDATIEKKIKQAGLAYKQAPLGAKGSLIVQIGVNKKTGEEWVYDRDGEVLTPDDYMVKVQQRQEAQAALATFGTRTQIGPGTKVIDHDVRTVSPEEVDALVSDVRMVAITDDKGKQARNTRVFPVKKMPQGWIAHPNGLMERDHVDVIAGGRYKGFLLDDMINANGRLIEGQAFKYHAARRKKGVVQGAHTERLNQADREPYVTVAEVTTEQTFKGKKIKRKQEKLFIQIGGGYPFVEARNALKKLSCNHETSGVTGCIPSIQWQKIEGSRAVNFYFEPKDYGTIMDALEGMTLSEQALKVIKDYYEDLSRAEQATNEENLANYRMDALGGFKEEQYRRVRDENGKLVWVNSKTGEELGEPAQKRIINADGKRVWVDAATGKEIPAEVKVIELKTAQQKALAWLDANGNQGVMALETGVGKTLTALSAMQKFIRDGFTDEGASYTTPDGREVRTNGRFLYVCPPELKGVPRKDADFFLTEKAAKNLKGRLDTINYLEFSGSSKTGRVPRSLKSNPYWRDLADRQKDAIQKATPPSQRRRPPTPPGRTAAGKTPKALGIPTWEPEQYVSIFFDEAHLMMSRKREQGLGRYKGGSAQAALNLYHPRKVALTASPMEKSPMDTYFLAAMTSNKPLTTDTIEGRDNLKEMKRFKQRFCETLGGRIVGVQQDPVVKQDLGVWVKRHIFHADKTGPEFNLPDLHAETENIEMPKVVEVAYKAMAKQFKEVMRGFVLQFRDLGVVPDRVTYDPETGEEISRTKGKLTKAQERAMAQTSEMFKNKFAPVIGMMTDLANKPDVAFANLARMIEEGVMPNGKPVPDPKEHPELAGLSKFLKALAQKFPPDKLRELSATIGNPKLTRATQKVTEKQGITPGSRTLLFSDDEDLCMRSGIQMSKEMGGVHVVALAKSIHFFDGGTELDELPIRVPRRLYKQLFRGDQEAIAAFERETDGVVKLDLPLTEKKYRRYYPAPTPVHDKLNPSVAVADWQQWAFRDLINPAPKYKTASLFGPSFAYGHNLQAFDTVIHLDRDTWNSENMKQRTARAWRQGQDQPVDEITLDATYKSDNDGEQVDDYDKTLDEIRSYFQQVEGSLFDEIIKKSQATALGKEWQDMMKRGASNMRLDQKVLELAVSPYFSRSKIPGAR